MRTRKRLSNGRKIHESKHEKFCLTMLFRFDWDMLPDCPLLVLDPTWGSVLCWDEFMPPVPTPLAVGRGTDGFPEGSPDMMAISKND